MINKRTLPLGPRVLTLYPITGIVLANRKWATTHVHGGGGGGHSQSGSGYTAPVHISSTTTEHDQIFLKTESGKELAYDFANLSVPFRDGHKVTVVSGGFEGEPAFPNLLVRNHDLGETAWFASGLKRLAQPAKGLKALYSTEDKLILILLAGGVVLCVMTAFAFGIAAIAMGLFIAKRAFNRRQKQITRELEALHADLVTVERQAPASAPLIGANA